MVKISHGCKVGVRRLNAEDNINGEYIQFINGSEVMGIGVNIGNAKRFTRPIPEWNEAKDRQSRDRVFREDSHDGQREVIADQIEEKTGVRPGLYDFDVFVDVYNMCAFARFFYVDTKYYKYFVKDKKDQKEIYTTPFYIIQENGKDVINTDSMGILIDPMKTFHLVGFCKKGSIGNSFGVETFGYDTKGGNLCSEYAIASELLYEKLNSKFSLDISTDLSHLGMDDMDMIFSTSGILFSAPMNSTFLPLLNSNALIYHINCDFMANYQVGKYPEGTCYVIKFKNPKPNNDGTIPKMKNTGGAVINEDYYLIPSAMRYVSPSENQYIKMEEKSFAAKRVTRYAKQFAIDCIANENRNFNEKDKNDTVECDYGDCKYTCSSNILSGKSEDAFIYEGGGEFWSNYEILYGSLMWRSGRSADFLQR